MNKYAFLILIKKINIYLFCIFTGFVILFLKVGTVYADPIPEPVDRRLQALDLLRTAEQKYRKELNLLNAFHAISKVMVFNGTDFFTAHQCIKFATKLDQNEESIEFLIPLLKQYLDFGIPVFEEYNLRSSFVKYSYKYARFLYLKAEEQTDGTVMRHYYSEAYRALINYLQYSENTRAKTHELQTLEWMCILKLQLSLDEKVLEECTALSQRSGRFTNPQLVRKIALILLDKEKYPKVIEFLDSYLKITWVQEAIELYPILLDAYESMGNNLAVRDSLYLLENQSGEMGHLIAKMIRINQTLKKGKNKDAYRMWVELTQSHKLQTIPEKLYQALFLARADSKDFEGLNMALDILENIPIKMRTTPLYWRVKAYILLGLSEYVDARHAIFKAMTWDPDSRINKQILRAINAHINLNAMPINTSILLEYHFQL